MTLDTDAALTAVGFTQADDGILIAPADAVVTLAPTGNFFELRIRLSGGAAVKAVLAKIALKRTHGVR